MKLSAISHMQKLIELTFKEGDINHQTEIMLTTIQNFLANFIKFNHYNKDGVDSVNGMIDIMLTTIKKNLETLIEEKPQLFGLGEERRILQ